jgi:lipopolysaccharide export system protein LptA
VDAFGNVLMSSDQSIARGEKGVYTVATGVAVLTGGVKITRGENQLNGEMAEVNLNTGVSRILSGGPQATGQGGRVRALFAPAKAAPPAGAAEQMNETRRPAPADDPARPRLPPRPAQ